jgi:hypothetical protein
MLPRFSFSFSYNYIELWLHRNLPFVRFKEVQIILTSEGGRRRDFPLKESSNSEHVIWMD